MQLNTIQKENSPQNSKEKMLYSETGYLWDWPNKQPCIQQQIDILHHNWNAVKILWRIHLDSYIWTNNHALNMVVKWIHILGVQPCSTKGNKNKGTNNPWLMWSTWSPCIVDPCKSRLTIVIDSIVMHCCSMQTYWLEVFAWHHCCLFPRSHLELPLRLLVWVHRGRCLRYVRWGPHGQVGEVVCHIRTPHGEHKACQPHPWCVGPRVLEEIC